MNKSRALIALSLVPFLALTAFHWPIGPLLTNSDYAQYILHAEALLHGRKYTDTGFIFSPYAPFAGPEAYPPGLPLTLLPLLAAFGRNAAVLRLLEIATAVGWFWCAAWYLQRHVGIWVASGAVMMTGVAIEHSYATNVVNSDLGFAFLVWALLLVADSDAVWTPARAFVVLLLGSAAMAYRVVGVTLIPAFLLFALVYRRKVGRWVWAPAATWIALAAVALITLPILSQYQDAVLTNPAQIVSRIQHNLRPARMALLDAFLYAFPSDRPNEIYHAIALVFLALGIVAFIKKSGLRMIGCFAICYSAFLLIAPAAVARYWWPLFPLATACLLLGVAEAARLLSFKVNAQRTAFALAAALSVSALIVAASEPRPITLAGQADLQSLFATVRERKDTKGARIYFVNPRILVLQTGRSAMPFIDVPETELLMQLRADGITHVVLGDLGSRPKSQRTLAALIAHHPNFFLPVYHNSSFALFRFGGP